MLLTFVIEIDGVSNGADTYRWSTDGGNTFVEEKQVIIQNTDQTLSHGLNIRFYSNKTGHHLGDRWSFVAQPKNQIVEISDTEFPAIDGKRTKLSLLMRLRNCMNWVNYPFILKLMIMMIPFILDT